MIILLFIIANSLLYFLVGIFQLLTYLPAYFQLLTYLPAYFSCSIYDRTKEKKFFF